MSWPSFVRFQRTALLVEAPLRRRSVEVGRIYGGPCRPERVRYPMVGTKTHVIHARLGTLSDVVEQDHQLAIVAPGVVASSPPRQSHERANHHSYAGP